MTKKYFRFALIWLILLISSQQLTAGEVKTSIAERRQAALSEAKQGKFDAALPAMQDLTKEAPGDVGIQADYVVVLTWAKKNQEALDFAKTMNLQTAPAYCISALARAARDTGQHEQALILYEQILNREPKNVDAAIGKTLTLTEAKQFAKAEIEILNLRQQYPNNPEVYRALAYLGTQSKQPVLVIDASTRLLELNNQDVDAARTLITAAREAGATENALALAEKYPQAADSNEIDRINNDSAAQHIAWGHYNPTIPAQRFADTDIALAKLDVACHCDWNGLDLSSDKNKNLVFDRMVALRDRYRMQEVIAHYQQLVSAKIDPPAYVLNAAADAYLYKRMSEEALKIYDAAIAKTPDNIVEVKMAKFYALIELERFDEATKLIDGISQDLAAYRNRPNNPVVRTDDYKLEADIKAQYARVYGDDFAMADQRFQALNDVGPMSNEVRLALADVWRLRGWPEKAEQRFYEINADYPDQVSPKVGLANTHLDLHDWRIAESEIKPLVSDYPENTSVQELGKRWTLHNKRQFTIDGYSSKSSGATFGSRSRGLNAALYSNPINYNFRAFALTQYQHATFPEGNGNALFPGLGLEYTNRDWRATGSLSKANISANGVTAAFTADYRLNDYWSFSSALDINSSQMPLRGLRVGTSGDLFSASGVYRWSELMSASMGVGYMHINDGNNRDSINATFDRRLITKPHYKLTAHLRTDASHNTEQNVLYYNPKRDIEVGAILDNEWILWRRYERSFGHRLQVGAGDYWQKDFGSDLTWVASYEQQIRLNDRFEVDYGVTRNRHPYDGINEWATQYFIRLNVLF